MYGFTIEDLPETFAELVNLPDIGVREAMEDVIRILHNTWQAAMRYPYAISDIGIEESASESEYYTTDEIERLMHIMREELMKSYDFSEQYVMCEQDDSDTAFEEFYTSAIEQYSETDSTFLTEVCDQCMIENYGEKAVADAMSYIEHEYAKAYGLKFTPDQWGELEDMAYEYVVSREQDTQYKNYIYEEETTMTANYKETITKTNAAIEAFKASIANQEVRDEFENQLYAAIAENPMYLEKTGLTSFIQSWMLACCKELPDLEPALNDQEVIDYIYENLASPIAEKIKAATKNETTTETTDKTEAQKETVEMPKTKKKCFIVRASKRVLNFMKKVVNAIKKFFSAVWMKCKQLGKGFAHAWGKFCAAVCDHKFFATLVYSLATFALGWEIGDGMFRLTSFVAKTIGITLFQGLLGWGIVILGLSIAVGIAYLAGRLCSLLVEKSAERYFESEANAAEEGVTGEDVHEADFVVNENV